VPRTGEPTERGWAAGAAAAGRSTVDRPRALDRGGCPAFARWRRGSGPGRGCAGPRFASRGCPEHHPAPAVRLKDVVYRTDTLTVRASSAVECMNSVLRMHQSRHKTVTQGLLDLKRLYWNCRGFREGKRRGHCPYEHLGLELPSYRFWDLLWMPTPAVEAI
jgi:hypothetical protein